MGLSIDEAKRRLLEVKACLHSLTEENQKDHEAFDMAIKALEQEPTTKNDLGVDCISREAVNRIINKWLSHPDYELKDHIYSMTEKIHSLPSVTPQEPVKKLEEQIKQLQNRCHAFTHGQICVFCLYECEHKAESEVEDGECK